MTPNNIAGMAVVNGLQIVALTDHNTCKNCPAFFEACKKQGLIAIAGMELTTAEDIHIICLFEQLDAAMLFDQKIAEKRMKIKNRIDIFGEQLIMDGEDNILGYEEYLLPNATTLSIEAAYQLAVEHGAVCYPAHIDRPANGIITTLGTFPDFPPFCCVEFKDTSLIKEYQNCYSNLKDKKILTSSDAHFLWDINEAKNSFFLEDEPYSSTLIRKKLFEYLNERMDNTI